MNTHMVIRKFTGPGSVQLMPGTQVDASTWGNIEQLESVGYLRPLNAKELGLDMPASMAGDESPRRGRPRLTPATA